VNEWWAALPAISHFFYIVAFAATLVLFVMLLLNIVGFGHGDADASGALGGHDFGGAGGHDLGGVQGGDHLAVHDTGLSWLSVRTLVAFLVGLGWGGVAVWDASHNAALTIVCAAIIGVIFMYVVFWLMNAIFKLRDSGNVSYNNAIGHVATVYITIPPKREGTGQVQVNVQGRLREVAAVTDGEERLAPGAKVVVTKLIDATTVVVNKERSE
jgi:membrane protein implicated in regulation of membrane protease activity